jgi:GTP-binding protein Era
MTVPDQQKTRAGFVAIIGAPNAGKSTLLNTLIGEKISITSPKPQTTRMKIVGVMTEDDTQICFIDTPGIFAAKGRLDRAMVAAAWDSITQADAIVLLVDGAARMNETLENIIGELQTRNRRVILALNKVDKVNKGDLLPLTQKIHDTAIVDTAFMIAGLTGDGVDDLKKHLAGLMPDSPWFFPEDQLSDMPSQLIAAEMTREQLYRQLQQELPYAATVIPESWETKADGSILIRQSIIIARSNHRPMVLGKQGSRIKAIGEAARKDIARFMDTPVHLFLEIKVDEKWQDRRDYYQMFGLEFTK